MRPFSSFARNTRVGCFCMARNSAKNHIQPKWAIPVGEPSGKARRVSSGTVVRRAA